MKYFTQRINMLDDISGYIPATEFHLLSFIEEILATLYVYEEHHIELTSLITDLHDTNDVNTFYRKALELYTLTLNNLYTIMGIYVAREMSLLSKAELLKALIDINNKEETLKEETYDGLENYEDNTSKLIYVLTNLQATADPIILEDIYKVDDELIESIEDMLRDNNDESIKGQVLENMLKRVAISITGTENMEILSRLMNYTNASINDILKNNPNMLITSTDQLLSTVVRIIIFSKERDAPGIAYLKIKDHMGEDYKDSLDVFIYSMLDTVSVLLTDKGLQYAK